MTLSDGAILEEADGAGDTVLTIASLASSTGTVNIGAARGEAAMGAGIVALDRVGFGAGTGELVFNHNTEGYEFNPFFTGSGTISHLEGDTTLTADNSGFAGVTNVQGGTLLLGDTALGGAINVSNGGAFGGTGIVSSLNMLSGGNLAPVGTLTVDGDARFDAGSFYLVDADPTGSDFLAVTGELTLLGGTVRHQASMANFDPISRYRIAAADGGILGTFDAVTSDLAFMIPELSYTETEVWLELLRNDVDFSDIAISFNQKSLGDALSDIDARDPLIQQLLMMSESSALQAYDQLAGEIHGSTASAAVQDVVFFHDQVLNRLHMQGDGRAETSGIRKKGSLQSLRASAPAGAWVQGFGSWLDFDGDGNAAGTRRDMTGFSFGYDHKLSQGLQAGVMAGFSNSSIRNDVDARSDSDRTTVGLYLGTGQYGPGLRVRGGTLLSWHDVETTRSLASVGMGAATGSYDAESYSLFAEVANALETDGYAVEPFLGVAHVGYDSDDFVEAGSSSALTVQGVSMDATFATLGVRGAAQLGGFGENMRATGTLGWRHAFGDTDSRQSASLLGNAFDVQGVPIAEDELLIKAGMDILVASNATFNIGYSGRLADDLTDHGLRLRLGITF